MFSSQLYLLFSEQSPKIDGGDRRQLLVFINLHTTTPIKSALVCIHSIPLNGIIDRKRNSKYGASESSFSCLAEWIDTS